MDAKQALPRLWKLPLVEVTSCLLAVWYVIMRAIRMPIQGDEWSVLELVHNHSFTDIIAFREIPWREWESEAHFLNALLAKCCWRLHSCDELLRIRIPSLIAFALFLSAIWWIRTNFQGQLFKALVFVSLLASAWVMDYFSLSRGYAFGLAFTALSLAGLLKAVERGDNPVGHTRPHEVAVWCASFAVVANFTFLHFYLAVCASLLLLWVQRYRKRSQLGTAPVFWRTFSRENRYLLANLLVLIVFFLPRGLLMVEHNAFFWGGVKGFFSDTVRSLILCSLYEKSPTETLATGLTWGLLILIGIVSVCSLWQTLRESSPPLMRKSVVLSLCWFFPFVMIQSTHLFLQVKYPIERAAVYFVPILVLQIACFTEEQVGIWLKRGLSLLLVGYIVLAASGANLTHTRNCRLYSQVPQIVHDLKEIHEKDGKPIVLYASEGTKWQMWYYLEKAVGTKDEQRLQEHGCAAAFDWIAIYEGYCGRARTDNRQFLDQTTHLLLSPEDDPPTWVTKNIPLTSGLVLNSELGEPRLLEEYPGSHWRLYAR